MAEIRIRVQREQGEALHLQFAALHREQAERDAGLCHIEPYAVEKRPASAGVILLADHGFNAYSTLIETRREIVDKKPDLVQRFVDASVIGWYHYLYGDDSAGNAMIKKINPE